jgi:hypothetical protein
MSIMTVKKHYWKKPNGKKATWRPDKIDEICITKLEEIFKIDWTVAEACSYAGISTHPFYEKLKSDEKFNQRISAAQDYMITTARRNVWKAIKEWDTQLSIRVIEKKDKRYNPATKIENWDWQPFIIEIVNYGSTKDQTAI